MSVNWSVVLNTGIGVAAGMLAYDLIKKLLAKIR